ncbi:malto-oligosyltrehalose synthase [Variovorax sp. PBL-E5]|uniref:malto-oligosyltrehalose synthase n=1 Tax=Variovorax sp. PBL-E5 TaxID=434014 RepID=UPI0013168BD5|nr:malto-oligosyltrehalose synthase [Variovorax sp. PBL-E5]VTU30638.1 Maltooligosyl trehalose synthase [Variovorax sp. PBL-E5]
MHDASPGLTDALRRLCGRHGIATGYHDVWGKLHAVAPASLVALLREAGVALPEEDTADPRRVHEDADAEAERAVWRRALPAVHAFEAGGTSLALSVRLPADVAQLEWHLVEEGGAIHSGTAQTASLQVHERAEPDGVPHAMYRLGIVLALPAGYHRLRLAGQPGETLLVCAPARCHQPPALDNGGRLWGMTVQLYGLRSRRNWGMGDFTDLAAFAARAASEGAAVIGLNPLHALFPHDPQRCSPYSPSSRAQLNVLYLDVEAIPDFRDDAAARECVHSPAFQARLAALRDAPLVDHAGVAAAKQEVLELLYRHFCARRAAKADDPEVQAFDAYRAREGDALHRHALFEALQAHFHRANPDAWGWPAWPEDHRDPDGAAVAAFAHSQAERVGFYEYLQWQAARQLAAVDRQCRDAGMPLGLYLDLAVSVDRGGSDTWRHRACFAPGARVGAPPDEFNPNGQDWGLPPLRPDRLREDHYRIFIEALRANMRSAGAVRIDHVMALMRLFWIPAGGTAHDGAYVHYPVDELLAIVALESQRQRCMVIGEDLGTVPDSLRTALDARGVLSYRLLYFEQRDGGFRPPSNYPRRAVVAVSTHDLATLAGWWSVHDLRTRLELGLYPGVPVFEQQVRDRARERVQLLLAVQQATGQPSSPMLATDVGRDTLDPESVEAVHAFLAETPSSLMVVQLEDALGEREQANMPGTTGEHPNWRRKYALPAEELWSAPLMQRLCRRLARSRPPAKELGEHFPRRHATRVPDATYRLQFHSGFTFDDAVRILPYLARLGISHVYCSPIQRAMPGSMHGYDVVAHDEINPELGGMPAFERFTAALKQQGMGQLLDLVPNHMGITGADNAWWMDVLENGTASLYARHFDIDWQPLDPRLAGKVLLPVLGESYGAILERGELQLQWHGDSGAFAIHYHAHRFPLAPQSFAPVLDRAGLHLGEPEAAAALASIATALRNLPAGRGLTPQAMAERARDKEWLKARLAALAAARRPVAQAIAFAVDEYRRPDQREALHQLLEAQAYRLAWWQVAADEINYRRFFDINGLAALRIERAQVFEATHALALDMAARGWVDGLRIDHPDGLHDPAQYFERLQDGFARRAGTGLRVPDAQGRPARPLYVVAEKIAASHEDVPESWAVHGTTGYRFANVANAVLVDERSAERLRRIWRGFTGVNESFDEVVWKARRDVARGALAADLELLAHALLRIAKDNRHTRDHTLNTLRAVLAAVVASMAVYRTYNTTDAPDPQDVHYVELAVREAGRRLQLPDATVFAFVRDALLGRAPEDSDDGARRRVLRFASRFQQFSAPVAAKGVEDTAFYRYFPLAAANEVGGEPDRLGMSVAAFHEAGADRQRRWPHTMLATSTHDNKRAEDVRLRIDVLSEMPARWRLGLRRWQAMNASLRAAPQAPSAAHEYLFYQTLLGTLEPRTDAAAHAAYVERIVLYMRKAAREGKTGTSWTQPDAEYEQALESFVRAALTLREDNRFLADLRTLAVALNWYGALNGLSLMLIKYGSPGVPDLYQGCELIDHSLVDPDNRRPVDYEARSARLAAFEALPSGREAHAPALARMASAPESGEAKLWFIWRLLGLRRELPRLFRLGSYEPLEVRGARAAHVVAFLRRHEGRTLIVLAARLHATMDREDHGDAEGGEPARRLRLGAAGWGDTRVLLPAWAEGRCFEDRLSGARHTVRLDGLALAQVFQIFPGAALIDVPADA